MYVVVTATARTKGQMVELLRNTPKDRNQISPQQKCSEKELMNNCRKALENYIKFH